MRSNDNSFPGSAWERPFFEAPPHLMRRSRSDRFVVPPSASSVEHLSQMFVINWDNCSTLARASPGTTNHHHSAFHHSVTYYQSPPRRAGRRPQEPWLTPKRLMKKRSPSPLLPVTCFLSPAFNLPAFARTLGKNIEYRTRNLEGRRGGDCVGQTAIFGGAIQDRTRSTSFVIPRASPCHTTANSPFLQRCSGLYLAACTLYLRLPFHHSAFHHSVTYYQSPPRRAGRRPQEPWLTPKRLMKETLAITPDPCHLLSIFLPSPGRSGRISKFAMTDVMKNTERHE